MSSRNQNRNRFQPGLIRDQGAFGQGVISHKTGF